ITVVVVDVVDDNDRALTASQAVAGDTGIVIPHEESGKGDLDDDDRPRGRAGRYGSTRPSLRSTRRAITFRVVLFMLVLVALFVVAIGAVGYYARGSYFVGVQRAQIVI